MSDAIDRLVSGLRESEFEIVTIDLGDGAIRSVPRKTLLRTLEEAGELVAELALWKEEAGRWMRAAAEDRGALTRLREKLGDLDN